MIKHVEVVVVKLVFHLRDLGNVYPLGRLRIIIGAHFRWRPFTEIEVKRVRDGAPSLASVWMIKDGASPECRLEGGRSQVQL